VEEMIESYLLQPHTDLTTTNNYPQSKAFRKLATFTKNSYRQKEPLDLVFTLFVDWFNPLGNKMAGKQVYLGILALTCLNIPSTL
jgi:hypothetical protein